jgi:phenylpropionate dioxygenase-like ring-hydroxylating dioxygenase large terminal subunit
MAEKPFGRRILNEPVAFYRKTDGTAAALFDRRGHPLTHGRIVGSNLQCGYQGIQFNSGYSRQDLYEGRACGSQRDRLAATP